MIRFLRRKVMIQGNGAPVSALVIRLKDSADETFEFGRLRRREQLARRAFFPDAAVVHEHQRVGGAAGWAPFTFGTPASHDPAKPTFAPPSPPAPPLMIARPALRSPKHTAPP